MNETLLRSATNGPGLCGLVEPGGEIRRRIRVELSLRYENGRVRLVVDANSMHV